MKKYFLLFIIIAALTTTGCKSLFTREGNLLTEAKNAKARGNYQEAVLKGAESVRLDNEYAEAIIFLRDVYPEANNYYLQKIEEKKNSGGKFVNDEIAGMYNYLHLMNEAVRTLPRIYDPEKKSPIDFSYTDYRPQLDKYRELAAEDHYQEGLKLTKLRGRENAKSAAKEFDTALSFVPGYKDAEKKSLMLLKKEPR